MAQISPSLYEGFPTTRFTDINQLFQEIYRTTGDVLIVTNVSPQEFGSMTYLEGRRKLRARRYHAESRTLIVKILTPVHAQLHLPLYAACLCQISNMGLKDPWKTIGATTFRSLDHPAGPLRADGGEADSSGGPLPDRRCGYDWPTLVFEAGESESLAALQEQMRWWFSVSHHEVKIVVLAKYDRARRTVVIERWEDSEPPATRPGAMMTRGAAARAPERKQTISITQTAAADPVSFEVTGELVLPFRLLFLRDAGPQESDVVISIGDLEEMGERVLESTM